MEFRTEKEIYTEAINDAVNRGLIQVDNETLQAILGGTYTANQYVLNLATYGYAHSDLENKAGRIYYNINLDTATGEALDNFGDLFNVTRVMAKPAMINITVSVGTVLGSDVTIPEGTRVLIDEVVEDSDLYVTKEDITLTAGSTSVSGKAVCLDAGFRNIVPSGTVRGLNGFPSLTVTNTLDGVNGANVEEDDEYRERIRNWIQKTLIRGSKEMLDDYLLNYEGLDDYKLIPLYDGVGSLKIVCDTPSTELENIAEGVSANCMIKTDKPVLCVLPDAMTLDNVTVNCSVVDASNYTYDELKQIVAAQFSTFINGGLTRAGITRKGMSIGENFVPAQLIKYLLEQVPEVENIYLTTIENNNSVNIVSEVEVGDTEQFKVTTLTVRIYD